MVIDHLDLETKHIYLATGVRSYHPVDDIYKEIRTLRRTNESYRGTHTPVVASGNVAKGGGKFTPRLATFNCGWKIVPEDVSHILNVVGEQITDEGEAGPACFDLEPLSASSKVIIQYEPPSAEVIIAGGAEIPEGIALEETVQAVKTKTDNLPDDPIGYTGLSDQHGSGKYDKGGGGGYGVSIIDIWSRDEKDKLIKDLAEIMNLLKGKLKQSDAIKLEEIATELRELGRLIIANLPDEIFDKLEEGKNGNQE